MWSSEDIRQELARVAPRRRCDTLAELSALTHTAGSLHLRGHGEIALHLDLSSSAVARRAFQLLRDLGVESEIRTYRQRALAPPTRPSLGRAAGGPRKAGSRCCPGRFARSQASGSATRRCRSASSGRSAARRRRRPPRTGAWLDCKDSRNSRLGAESRGETEGWL